MGFDCLYEEAKKAAHTRKLSAYAEAGSAGAVIMSATGRIYAGVCIDTACLMGFCAEHAAAAAMITAGKNIIKKVIAVCAGDGRIIPACGRCREFMSSLSDDNGEAEVMVGPDVIVKLKELLPYSRRRKNDR